MDAGALRKLLYYATQCCPVCEPEQGSAFDSLTGAISLHSPLLQHGLMVHNGLFDQEGLGTGT